jgi:hypothetical protein
VTASLFLISLTASGCLKTYVKVGPDLPDDARALMVSTRLMTNEESNSSDNGFNALDIAEAVTDTVANIDVDGFAEDIIDDLTPFLQSQGFTPVFDEARAKSLQSVDWGELGNSVTALTGGWTDPRGAALWVGPTTLFRKRVLQNTVEKLGAQGDEYFLFTTVTIHESRSWLIMRYPLIQTTVIVSDSAGTEVLRAQGIGRGDRTPLLIDRSVENLKIGMEEAIIELGAATPEAL